MHCAELPCSDALCRAAVSRSTVPSRRAAIHCAESPCASCRLDWSTAEKWPNGVTIIVATLTAGSMQLTAGCTTLLRCTASPWATTHSHRQPLHAASCMLPLFAITRTTYLLFLFCFHCVSLSLAVTPCVSMSFPTLVVAVCITGAVSEPVGSQDAVFEESFMNMVFPGTGAAAGSLWNYDASMVSSQYLPTAAFTSALNAHTNRSTTAHSFVTTVF